MNNQKFMIGIEDSYIDNVLIIYASFGSKLVSSSLLKRLRHLEENIGKDNASLGREFVEGHLKMLKI